MMAETRMSAQELGRLAEQLRTGVRELSDEDTTRAIRRDPMRQFLQDIQSLLFPHCVSGATASDGDMEESARALIDKLATFIHQATPHACREPECHELRQAHDTANQFFQMLPDVQREALTDADAAYEGDPAAKGRAEIISTYPGFFATLVYRLAHRLHRMNVPLLPRMMTELAHSETGIDIHPGAEIGLYFFIDHGTGVVIGETTQIGDRVTLYQGVTLGALNFPHDGEGRIIRGTKRHPTIEHDVVIYSEASILGGETVIGHDSVIGGNVWLTEGVPPFSKVTTKSTIALRTRQEPVS